MGRHFQIRNTLISFFSQKKLQKNSTVNFPKLYSPRSVQNRCQRARRCPGTLRSEDPGNSPKEGDFKNSRCLFASKPCMAFTWAPRKKQKIVTWSFSRLEFRHLEGPKNDHVTIFWRDVLPGDEEKEISEEDTDYLKFQIKLKIN